MRSLKDIDRRVVSSAAILFILVLALTNVVDKAVNWSVMDRMNRQSESSLRAWSRQAIGTAAAAAVINGGLSVMEDSEVQAAPAGLGLSLALGDAVRPVNDMVSRVLSVAVVSAVSLEIQKTLIKIGAWVGLKWLLSFSLVFLLLAVWWDHPAVRRLAWAFFMLALLARFAIPGAVFLTATIGNEFTERTSIKAQQELEQLKADTSGISKLNVWKHAANVKARAKIYIRMGVNYIAVFVLQTLIMPVLILWALIKLPGFLLSATGVAGLGESFMSMLRGSDTCKERSLTAREPAPQAQA